MNPFLLTLRNLRSRKLTALIAIGSIALSACLLLSVEKIRHASKTSFMNTVSGTDLIVGPRSGPEQLLLSSVFRIGNPTNKLTEMSHDFMKNHPEVLWSFPISLGDSHRGHRVLATNKGYFEYFNYSDDQRLALAKGTNFAGRRPVILGSQVAKELDYELGTELILAHGAGDHSHHHHDEAPFIVTGILKPTGTPVDFTLHTKLEDMARLHQEMTHAHHNHDPLAIAPPLNLSINAIFVGLKSKNNIPSFQRLINTHKTEALSAIIPAVTLLQIWQVLSVMEKSLLLISICVALVSFCGLMAILLSSLNERRREMAILRSLGAGPKYIFMLILIESLVLSLLGCLLGVAALFLLLNLSQVFIVQSIGIQLQLNGLSSHDMLLLLAIVLTGPIAGLVPAYRLYNYSLNDGMTPRT
jgi:putative ABC transport system permease protein